MTKRVSHPGATGAAAAKHGAGEAVVIAAAADGAAVEIAAPAMIASAAAGGAVPVAMVQDAAAPAPAQDTMTPPATTTATTDDTADSGARDYTPFIIGGVLLAGGIVALAASGGDDDDGTPAPTPTPTPTNTAPTFGSATTATIAENAAATTVVIDVNATDAQANTITYTLGGTDAALFNINASTGEVTLKASADFETKASYAISVTATDNGSPAASASQNITVTVTNVNEAPAFATATGTATVAENIAATTVVFDAGATDPDAATTLTYALTGTDAAAFTIDAATGEVRFVASPDFETKASYSFNVTASDGANGLTATQAVTVNVTDVNENGAPVFTSAATATVAEGAAVGTVILDAETTDPENNTVTYSLGGADAAAFTIDPASGELRLVAAADFETKASYSLNIVATDNGATAASTTQAVTVTVTDVNEAPVITGGDTATVAIDENVAVGTQVIDIAATDVDAGSVITYSIGGADASAFAIDAATGVVTLAVSPDFEAKTSYSFTVTATDNGNPAASDTQTVTVNVNNLADLVDIDGGTIPATETRTFAAGASDVAFGENAAEGNLSVITGFGVGDTIVTDVATSRYSFSSVGDDLVISLNNGGVVTSITLQDAISPTSFVFNEATAEAALGGFDFFRTSAAPPPAASGFIDGAGAAAAFDASTAANTYTERAGVTNNTTISGFTADDRIVVSGTPGDSNATRYSFSSLGDDLTISFNQGGISSRIVITDVVGLNTFVSDEASAERAIGFDFFSYA